VEIAEIEDTAALSAIIDALDTYDLAVFVSPTAAEKGWNAVRERRVFPGHLKVAAVGLGTARALERLGMAGVIVPARGADSESLLAEPELQRVSGQRIVIFRGVGGRDVLRKTLLARGGSVDYAECYRRAPPDKDTTPLTCAFVAGEIHATVVTSSEGLRNLYDMLDARARAVFAATPLFVPHARIAAAARELNVKKVVETAAGDEAMAASLVRYFASV
jgi:uroporphyrinogen-III synthase